MQRGQSVRRGGMQNEPNLWRKEESWEQLTFLPSRVVQFLWAQSLSLRHAESESRMGILVC